MGPAFPRASRTDENRLRFSLSSERILSHRREFSLIGENSLSSERILSHRREFSLIGENRTRCGWTERVVSEGDRTLGDLGDRTLGDLGDLTLGDLGDVTLYAGRLRG